MMRTLGSPPAPSDPRWSLRRELVHTHYSGLFFPGTKTTGVGHSTLRGTRTVDMLFSLSPPPVQCSFGRYDSWPFRRKKHLGKQKRKCCAELTASLLTQNCPLPYRSSLVFITVVGLLKLVLYTAAARCVPVPSYSEVTHASHFSDSSFPSTVSSGREESSPGTTLPRAFIRREEGRPPTPRLSLFLRLFISRFMLSLDST